MKGHVHFAHIKMYAVLYWIVILSCWQETQAKFKISMLNRTRVALAGDVLDFNLSVEIPANYSSNIACYTRNREIWSKAIKNEFSDKSVPVPVTPRIKMHNSSSSGNYYCRIKLGKQSLEVHWVVHVRDKGYEVPNEELEDGIITMMAFSGILLIFSVAGSLFILKSYKDQTPCRDDQNAVAEQRPEDSDDVMLDEDHASASLYTALQHRSSSIYDTLNEENTRETNSDKKHCEAPEEVFDSVYENL